MSQLRTQDLGHIIATSAVDVDQFGNALWTHAGGTGSESASTDSPAVSASRACATAAVLTSNAASGSTANASAPGSSASVDLCF
jgi:hypothetical protein